LIVVGIRAAGKIIIWLIVGFPIWLNHLKIYLVVTMCFRDRTERCLQLDTKKGIELAEQGVRGWPPATQHPADARLC
jgi:hypothetical protein